MATKRRLTGRAGVSATAVTHAWRDPTAKRQEWGKGYQVPPDVVRDGAWLGSPSPEASRTLSDQKFSADPAEDFHAANKGIREAGVARDVAARGTREVIQAQGFDRYPNLPRTWDDLPAREKHEVRLTEE